MSWNHSDYIELVSSFGTILAAGIAAYAALENFKSSKEHKQTIEKQEASIAFDKLLDISKVISAATPNNNVFNFTSRERGIIANSICLSHVVIISSVKDIESKHWLRDMFILMLDPLVHDSLINCFDITKSDHICHNIKEFRLTAKYSLAQKFFKDTYQAAQ